MLDATKSALKRLLYVAGALPFYHRVRNRCLLTVAMFHRVLALADPRWNGAIPEWTLSEDVFDECLRFFKRHYTIIGLHDLLASLRAEQPLPPYSLLLTFDDGYADNVEYALPVLRHHGLPAAIFVTSDAIGQRTRPWTEDFLQAYLTGIIAPDEVASVHALLGPGGACSQGDDTLARVWDIVRRGPQLKDAEVQCALSRLREPLTRAGDPPQMLNAEQLRALTLHGVSIGAHGKTHTAFPAATNLAAELREPRRVLGNLLAAEPQERVFALSLPHGAYTQEIIEQAVQEGYQLIFTVREELSPVMGGRLGTPIIGRINVSEPAFAPKGCLRPDLLAFHFFRRPRAKLAQPLMISTQP